MPVLVTGIPCSLAAEQHVDPRDKPGGDDIGESATGLRRFRAVAECELHSR